MQNLKNVRMPQGNAAGRLGGLIIGGGALLYGASNSLFNVEGGHRAIVFNRITGIKEDVRSVQHIVPQCFTAQQLVTEGAGPDRCMRKGLTSCFHGLTGPLSMMFAPGQKSFRASLARRICRW